MSFGVAKRLGADYKPVPASSLILIFLAVITTNLSQSESPATVSTFTKELVI